MIGKHVTIFCNEELSSIENFKLAINDLTQTWECHHRLETDLGLSSDELKEQNLYYNRPASELIFLTKADHVSLHTKGTKFSNEHKQKISIANKGKKPHKNAIIASINTRRTKKFGIEQSQRQKKYKIDQK